MPPRHAINEIDALFDWLDGLSVEQQAQTQVWLDLTPYGATAEKAFGAKYAAGSGLWPINPNGWRASHGERRFGIACELLLRFPLVFPVFVIQDWAAKSAASELERDGAREPGGAVTASTADGPVPPYRTTWIERTLRHPVHFWSWVGTPSSPRQTDQTDDWTPPQLRWFAQGLRTYFDPTGLRTAVTRNALGAMFGQGDDWTSVAALVEQLAQRLDRECVAVDDENEFAQCNAYLGWRSGYLGWAISTFNGLQAWPDQVGRQGPAERVLIRDIDLRFPDYPDQSGVPAEQRIRGLLETYKHWPPAVKRCLAGCGRLHLRTVSACSVGAQNDAESDELAFDKPLDHLHQLFGPRCAFPTLKDRGAAALFIARIPRPPTNSVGPGSGGHSAPYANAAIADALLAQSRTTSASFMGDLLRALLAHEAYVILGGMSPIKGSLALQQMHLAEVRAETRFAGVSKAVDTTQRATELESTMDRLFAQDTASYAARNGQDKRAVLARLWGELKAIYKSGEIFDAADQATKHCLANLWSRPTISSFVVVVLILSAPLALMLAVLQELVWKDWWTLLALVVLPLLIFWSLQNVILVVRFLWQWRNWWNVFRARWRDRWAARREWSFFRFLHEAMFQVVRRLVPALLDISGWTNAAVYSLLLVTGITAMLFFTTEPAPVRDSSSRMAVSLGQAKEATSKILGSASASTIEIQSRQPIYVRADVCAKTDANVQMTKIGEGLLGTGEGWLGDFGTRLVVFIRIGQQLLVSALQSNPAEGYLPINDCLKDVSSPQYRLMLLTSVVFVATIVAIGILVSIIFRKVTRS